MITRIIVGAGVLVALGATAYCSSSGQRAAVKRSGTPFRASAARPTRTEYHSVLQIAKPTAFQTGAAQLPAYLPLLQGKRVGLVVNQTSLIGRTHLVDTLKRRGVHLTAIFAPEHGFRGEAADGATITDGRDARSGVPVRSVYGSTKKPTPEMLADVDVLVFDIQDVGTRFYTFISTLHYVMEAAAEQGKSVVVLDRPNPNGALIDGPVLEAKHRSFVGLDPLPICHGLTVGELAKMLNGEKWLAGGRQCPLTVVPVKGHYTHATPYTLPVRPSPNLPTARAVALYPSLCLLEGTTVSVGRGTDRPFEVAGAPTQPATRPYQFTPRPNAGSPTPPLNGQLCYGLDLHQSAPGEPAEFFTVQYVLDFYRQSTDKPHFFTKYFEQLAGTDSLRAQIIAGRSEAQIRASWQPGLAQFKQRRQQYLLYPEK